MTIHYYSLVRTTGTMSC